MKKSFFIIASLFLSIGVTHAQGLLETVSGKCYYMADEITEANSYTVKNGFDIILISKDSVLLYEDMELGVHLFAPDKIHRANPTAYSGDASSYFAQGKKVHIPLTSDKIAQRWGSRFLLKAIMEDNYWIVVGCAAEADFILEYVYDEKGSDHAYLRLSDGNKKTVLKTGSVSASDWVPAHAGEESSEKLYKKYLKKGIYKGKWNGFNRIK